MIARHGGEQGEAAYNRSLKAHIDEQAKQRGWIRATRKRTRCERHKEDVGLFDFCSGCMDEMEREGIVFRLRWLERCREWMDAKSASRPAREGAFKMEPKYSNGRGGWSGHFNPVEDRSVIWPRPW